MATKEDFEKLDLVKQGWITDRLGRTNVTFAFNTNFEHAKNFINTERKGNRNTFLFPEVF